MIATIWEVWNDQFGDTNKSYDVAVRTLLLIAEALLLRIILHKPFFVCLLLSTAVFFMLFDYAINYALIRNKVIQGNWFTYAAKQGWFDNLKWWKFSPWLRFGIKLAYLIVALILFFI